MKKVLILVIAVSVLAGAASSSQTYRARAAQGCGPAAMIEVKVCPMNGEAVTSADAPSTTVGNYKVYFCCANHKEQFNALSEAQKQQKIAVALKKQETKKG